MKNFAYKFSPTTKHTLSAFLVVALAACGGGGGSSPTTPVPTPTPPSGVGFSGSIAAPLNTSSTRILYDMVGGTTSSSGTSNGLVTQDSNGALVKIGNFSLSGTIGVKEISGNADYAIGRWTAGTVSIYDPITNKTDTSDLSSSANGSNYYVALHSPTAALANYGNGSALACAETHVTKPKWNGGSSVSTDNYFANSFSITSGSIVFDATGNAAVQFTANVASKTSNASTTYTTTISWIGTQYNGFTLLGIQGLPGRSLSNGFVDLGTNSGNGLIVGGIYNIKLADNSQYTGEVVRQN